MLARFWGTRGSLPVALDIEQVQSKVRAALKQADGRRFADAAALEHFITQELPFNVAGTYGGNTSCVQIDGGSDEYLICDMGSGARQLGNAVMSSRWPHKKPVYHILMSHAHWDHIMGFPFFTPVYVPGQKIRVYGCHDTIEMIFRTQHSRPFFPVDFDELGAEIEFVTLDPEKSHEIAGHRVRAILQRHESDSYAYRIEHRGKSLVYATDGEHRIEDEPAIARIAAFFEAADLVIFDAMYSLADAVTVHADWGHSSNLVAVDLAARARVRHLCLFHHEPSNNDSALARIERDTDRYRELTAEASEMTISTAYDGLEIEY